MLNDILLAIATLSRIPIPINFKGDTQKAVGYYPIVGFIASIVNYSLFWGIDRLLFLTGNVQRETIALPIVLATYFFLFGYFHFDGLIDTVDSFLSQLKTKEERLKILKDPHIGSFALLFGTIYILAYYSFLKTLPRGWFLAPIFSRMSIPMLLMISTPAKQTGLAYRLFPFKKVTFIIALFITILPIALYPYTTIIGLLSALIIPIPLHLISKNKIGGITGDTMGTTICLTEVLYLFLINFLG